MSEKPSLIAVQLTTTHTTTGNPRRVWVLLDTDGTIRATCDEGYTGWAGAREAFEERFPRERWTIVKGPSFETTPREYRETVKFGRAGVTS